MYASRAKGAELNLSAATSRWAPAVAASFAAILAASPALGAAGVSIPGAFLRTGSSREETSSVKALDGRAVNGHYSIFYGALSDVEYTITVTDTSNGSVKTYSSPQGQMASRADTTAFR